MERVEILSKETLLCYLINELSNGNYEVTTHLDRNGCWLGEISIKGTNEILNEDQDYFHNLAKAMLGHNVKPLRADPKSLMRKSDFSIEHDEVILSECADCGDYDISPREVIDTCKCGGRMIHETAHEGLKCNFCGLRFDPWDNIYRGKERDCIICEECYKTLDN